MAKQYSVNASVNGGAVTTITVTAKNDEPIMSQGWLWRLYESAGFVKGDTATFSISSISGPSSLGDPMTWSAVPPTLLIAISLGQISLAFID